MSYLNPGQNVNRQSRRELNRKLREMLFRIGLHSFNDPQIMTISLQINYLGAHVSYIQVT